jgi:hypothetical protein
MPAAGRQRADALRSRELRKPRKRSPPSGRQAPPSSARKIRWHGNRQHKDECLNARPTVPALYAAIWLWGCQARRNKRLRRRAVWHNTCELTADWPPRQAARKTGFDTTNREKPVRWTIDAMGDEKPISQGLGASVLRLEDDRYLRGRGRLMARTVLAKAVRSVRWRRLPTPSMTRWHDRK